MSQDTAFADSIAEAAALRKRLERFVGRSIAEGEGEVFGPDPVNVPMIRHWVDALDDRNPIYLDPEAAAKSRHGELVAPPAMLQTWTMARPKIEGIAARGGAPMEIEGENVVTALDAAGYGATLATNSELVFDRYLHPGEAVSSEGIVDEISELKGTALGAGFFVTWVTTYRSDRGDVVGKQVFRIFKFMPGAAGPPKDGAKREPRPEPVVPQGEVLPGFDLDVTATVIVAGAIASRDFMPVHHDQDYAKSQHAPDIFMNILTTNGYVARYVTDWAGPEARLERIAVRLGAPAIPGKVLSFSGQVAEETRRGDERVLDVAVRAANALGDHATGTVRLTLPVG